MPTYEYECEKCSHVFEKFQGITEEPLKDCPKCAGSVRRIIHGGAGLVFKGSGFYITDSRTGSGKKASPPPCGNADKPCAKSCPASEK